MRPKGKELRVMSSRTIVPKLLAVTMVLCVWAAGSMNASASDFVFDLENVGAVPLSVQVTLHQQDSDTLRITVDQDDSTNYADLTAFLFHIDESLIDPTNLTFTFFSAIENITGNAITPTLVSSAGLNNQNFQGLNGYDVALQFGQQGIGGNKGDIKSITFDITTSIIGGLDLMTFMPFHMDLFMAVRATSAYNNQDREGSSKLTCCGVTVPAPSSSMGLFALAMGGLLWRKRRTS